MATGSWRPKWPVWALIIAVFAGLIALLLTKILFPELVENIPLEHRTPGYHEEKISTTPQRIMFAVGVAIVFETVRRLLK